MESSRIDHIPWLLPALLLCLWVILSLIWILIKPGFLSLHFSFHFSSLPTNCGSESHFLPQNSHKSFHAYTRGHHSLDAKPFSISNYTLWFYKTRLRGNPLVWDSQTVKGSSCSSQDKRKEREKKKNLAWICFVAGRHKQRWCGVKPQQRVLSEVNLTAPPELQLLFPPWTGIWIWFPCQSSPHCRNEFRSV